MIFISVGFITDGFVSAYNPLKQTLVINNIDLGIPVDGYSIIPNDSYITQETGFGTIKTVWSHLSLSGDVTLYMKDVSEATANFIDKICLKQDSNYYVSFLGYMYRTEAIDVTIQPSAGTIARLDVTLTFYGKLPYSTPIFRPGFSTTLSTEISRIPSFDVKQTMFIPLPGQTLKNREDTVMALVRNNASSVYFKVFSMVKDYVGKTVSYDGVLTTNFEHPDTSSGCIFSVQEGIDDIATAEITSSSTVVVKFIRIKDNDFIPNFRNSVTLSVSAPTRVQIKNGILHVYSDSFGSYRLETFNLMASNIASTKKIVEDSTKIRSLGAIPQDGQTSTAPLDPPTTGSSYNMVLGDGKRKLLFVADIENVTNAYDSFIFPKRLLESIPGVTDPTCNIEQVHIISDNKLAIFFRNLRAGSSYVHYVIVNFRDTDNERNNKKNAFIVDYRISSVNIPKFQQSFTYFGISQTNTAVISNGKCYMSTEAYSDFYVEDNVHAITQSTTGFKLVMVQSGNDLVLKCMSK